MHGNREEGASWASCPLHSHRRLCHYPSQGMLLLLPFFPQPGCSLSYLINICRRLCLCHSQRMLLLPFLSLPHRSGTAQLAS